ncbi:MAG: chromosome segregation protein SMC [Candidatus Chloroheliales bacterium]|nr:MAG: chromosome segregation protein SMC [Chloroflexota bacterium]
MIPLKLKLTNFLSYHSAEVDFAGIKLACLCGENGAGKSALLAGMTWALWGKARDKVSDDELIASGAQEMAVDFEFGLGDHLYRVLRQRSKMKGGESRLIFQVCQTDTGIWMPLNEPSIRGTQHRIDETLRMDYDTFINSAFLLQGRADEFARKAPGDRKKVLAEILGLSYYDRLEVKAKGKRQEVENKLRDIDNLLTMLQHQIAELPAQRRLARETGDMVLALDQQLEAQVTVVEQLAARASRLEALHDESVKLEQRITQATDERQTAENALHKAQADIARHTALLAKRDEVERGFADLLATRNLLEAMNTRLSQYHTLSGRKTAAEGEIKMGRTDLEHRLDKVQTRIREVEAMSSRVAEYEAELERQRSLLAGFELTEQQAEAARQRIEDYKRLISNLEVDNERLNAEMKSLRDRLTMLKKSDHQRCPVCDSELGEGGYARIEQHYIADGTERKEQVARNQRRVDELRLMLGQAETDLIKLNRQLDGRINAEKQETRAADRLSDAQKAGEQLADLRQQLADLLAQLDANAYAPKARQELASVQQEIAALGYDESAHEELRRRNRELADFERRERELREAQSRLLLAEQAATHAQATRNDKTAIIEQYQAHYDQLAAQLEGYDELRRQLDDARGKKAVIEQQRGDALRQQTEAEQRVRQLQDNERERDDKVEERKLAADDKGIYDELVQAFGRKGVQAMIIDSALPELEENANELLGRMTDGRMTVRLETQRPTSKGDSTVETLDLKIADGGGYRSYELYSGGEAFRINFAVRVAMSKLLAHRAGARLQTLIIDEGFGTLDGNGRERLIQAIRAVQSDFECILVITHIDELKDEFPYRLEVTKGQDGSHVELMTG